MAENDSKAIAERLRFLANHVINGDSASADVVRAYADELDPQPIELTLSRRQFEILRALVDGAPHANSMTNRASHARWDWRLRADVSEDDRIGLVHLFETFD